ncbi:MAG: response regulator [Legionellaceae bacterium]|nr:response regulator [Legionellaceae bacterium]
MSGATKRILVIDDEEAVRRSFELALEDTGFELTTVDSGAKGVKEVVNGYDLVFLDLKMPNMNGVETLKKIREFSLSLPVYIVTAFHKEFLIELDEVRKIGLEFQLLRKPIGSVEIQTLVQSVLDKPVKYE